MTLSYPQPHLYQFRAFTALVVALVDTFVCISQSALQLSEQLILIQSLRLPSLCNRKGFTAFKCILDRLPDRLPSIHSVNSLNSRMDCFLRSGPTGFCMLKLYSDQCVKNRLKHAPIVSFGSFFDARKRIYYIGRRLHILENQLQHIL